MSEPNTQQDPAATQPAKKMSSRATNFLMMNAAGGAQAVDPEHPAYAEANPVDAEGPADIPQSAETTSPSETPAKRTGVISSTIHPAQRAGNQHSYTPEGASRTNQLESARPRTSQTLSPEEKAKAKDEKIDRLADRITDVLKRINDIKTGMLNPDMQTSQKLQIMAERSPAFSKFLAVLLTQLEPVLMLMQRINQKLVEKNVVQHASGPLPAEEGADTLEAPPPPEKVSFIELAEKNIIFCDNRKRALYTLEQMRGKHGYVASEEVLAPMILENIIQAFHEVAPKAKAIPTPTSGIYANIPMDQVMENINDEAIMRFLNYVQRFPRGYVGKNFRITESFAGWVVSGTPDD